MTDIATVQLARVRRERIRLGMHSFIATRKDIADAYRERDWETLGHDSWEAYIDAEFSEERVRLSAGDRRDAVTELRMAGLSQRAIGSALGVDQKTVSNDLRSMLTEENSSVGPERIVSLDGRERPATQPPRTQTPGPVDKSSPVDPGVTPAPAVESPVLTEPQEPDQPAERPAPAKWDPAEREAHRLDVERIQIIDAARSHAKTIVTTVLGEVATVVSGADLGEHDLITEEMVAGLQRAVDLLASRLEVHA